MNCIGVYIPARCKVVIFEDDPFVVLVTVYIGDQFVKDHDCFIMPLITAFFLVRGLGNLYLQKL
jgi:hypothetical protein